MNPVNSNESLTTYPRLVPCGDRTVLIYLGAGIDEGVNRQVHATAAALRALAHPALTEVSPAYNSVLVEYDPVRIGWEALTHLIQDAAQAPATTRAGRTVQLPVCYGGDLGPDLNDVATRTGLPADEVVARHAAPDYRVYCLGFSPGFLYLGGLDPALHTPRRETPRTRLPAGSVGIGGQQTGAYPRESPGGWHLIGRTPLALFDPERQPPTVAEAGDTVRFQPISAPEYESLRLQQPVRRQVLPAFTAGQTGLRILRPGLSTTVQDLGRRGYQAYGVPTGGAVDYWSLMVGNWLLGNRSRAGALEITLLGPEVEFTGPVAFCLTGAPVAAELIPADGGSPRPVAGWRALLAGPGDRLRIGTALAGCRAYLCVAGGIDLPPVLGSVATDLLARLGPFDRPLQTGDWLPVGLPVMPPADLAGRALPADAIPSYEGDLSVRVTLGPQLDAFTDAGVAAFLGSVYTISADADRQGMRLNGPALGFRGAADILSEGMPAGSVQVTAAGQPILALANRGTTGGYAKIAVALYADVARAAQLRPGDRVRFEAVDLAEAHAIAWAERRRLAQVRRYLQRAVATEREAVPARPAAIVAPEEPAATAAVAPAAAEPVVPTPAAQPPGGARRLLVRVAGREYVVDVEEVR